MTSFAEMVSITCYLFSPHNVNWDPRIWYRPGDEIWCVGALAVVESINYMTITVRWPSHSSSGIQLSVDSLIEAGAITPNFQRLTE